MSQWQGHLLSCSGQLKNYLIGKHLLSFASSFYLVKHVGLSRIGIKKEASSNFPIQAPVFWTKNGKNCSNLFIRELWYVCAICTWHNKSLMHCYVEAIQQTVHIKMLIILCMLRWRWGDIERFNAMTFNRFPQQPAWDRVLFTIGLCPDAWF